MIGAKRKPRVVDPPEDAPHPSPSTQSQPGALKKHKKAVKDERRASAAAPKHACSFYEMPSWGFKVKDVAGNAGNILGLIKPRRAMQIANPVLEAAYALKKEELVARLGADNVNERFLFHGTTFDKSEAIVRSNFCLTKVSPLFRMLIRKQLR